MSGRNRVTLLLDCKDQASKVFQNLKGTIRSSVFEAGMMERAFDSAFRGIEMAGAAAMKAFQNARDVQLQTITGADNLSAAMKVSFQEANDFQLKAVEILEEKAARLPGEADDYAAILRGVGDDFVDGIRALNGGVLPSTESMLERMTEISSRVGVLAKNAEITAPAAQKGIERFLSGTATWKQVQILDLFQNNKRLRDAVQRRIDIMGKDIKKMTAAERYQIFELAVKESVTDQYIEEASKSADSYIQSYKAFLFGQAGGLFSLSRDLDKKASGNQSVFAALTDTLRILLFDDKENNVFGLVTNIGRSLQKLFGFDFGDPMAAMRAGVLALNSRLEKINNFLTQINKMKDGGAALTDSLKGMGLSLWKAYLEWMRNFGPNVADLLNQSMRWLNNLDWKAIGTGIGQFIAAGIDNLTGLIVGIDWGQVIKLLFNVGEGVVYAIGSALLSVNWSQLAHAALIAIGVVFLQAIGSALGVVAWGIGQTATVTLSLVGILVATIVRSWGDLTSAWSENWSGLMSFYAAEWESIKGIASAGMVELKKLWNDLKKVASAPINTLIDTFRNFSQWLDGKIPSWMRGKNDGSNPSFDHNGGYFNVPNRAGGFIPGILAAAMRESQQMPSGAGLVVANTTEAILNQRQQQALASRMGGSTTVAPQIHVYPSPGMDEQALADKVFRLFAQEFTKHQRNQMAPAF